MALWARFFLWECTPTLTEGEMIEDAFFLLEQYYDIMYN